MPDRQPLGRPPLVARLAGRLSAGGPRTVAFAESATQLLNVAEWADASGDADGLRVDVLPPDDPFTLRQIRAVTDLIAPLGLRVRLLPVRARSARRAAAVAQATRDLAGASRLIVGDPFSRFLQSLLPLSAASDVVVVDDGTATWQFVKCVDAGAPMVRWDVPVERAEERSVRASAFYAPSSQRRLTVFSCLDDSQPAGAELVRNDYAWCRSWRRPDVVADQVDVLGVSLVGSGVVRHDAYVGAVSALAARHGGAAVRYLPHRRESDELVAEIAALPGVRVQRSALPVELALREGPVAAQVITFPSTASHTLPVVLGDLRERGLRVVVQPIADGWFTEATPLRARAFVRRIADSAPVPSAPTPPSTAEIV